MVLYIVAVGFSEFNSKEKAEKLVEKIVKDPTRKYISNFQEDKIKVEYYKEYGEDFGLVVRGELSADEELTVYSLIPYSIGRDLTDTEEIDVMKVGENDEYTVYAEESKSGTPFSFYLQNVVDYLELKDNKDTYIEGVRLVAFSADAKIILPIDKDEEYELFESIEDDMRKELFDKAKDGDDEALDILEEEAIEASEALEERLKEEDLLSILEGFFVPVDDSDDVYSVLGSIEEVSKIKNKETKEEMFLLKVKCMSIYIDILINEKSLVGEPSVGMRFKGTAWVQGGVDFKVE